MAGQAKRRLSQTEKLLRANPLCIYCGAPATTTDHCPPRCFFEERHWPEGYEFSACHACNDVARAYEQALAVIFRTRLTRTGWEADRKEWEKLARGVKNNQPAVVAEWQSMTRNQQKHALRDVFGGEGDQRRREGWTAISLGHLTRAMIDRFMVKLAKALYYRHNNTLFDGILYVLAAPTLPATDASSLIESMLSMAPMLPLLKRNNKYLFDQFIYRFNHSPEHGVMYAVVQFSDQFIYQLMALSREMDARLSLNGADFSDLPAKRFDCAIEPKGATPSS